MEGTSFSAEEVVKKCYQCAICSGICPKARVKPGFLPRRMVFNTATGHVDRVVESGGSWDCLTCGVCEEKCPMNVGILEMIKATRREGMDGYCKIAHSNTLAFYNIMASEKVKPKKTRFLAKDVQIDSDSDVLYYMGCIPYFDIIFKDDVNFEGMGIADNTIRLLNAVGIKPAVLEEEKCCGHDQLWRGQNELFEKLAKQNLEYLKKYKTIVTSCPECYRTLAVDYNEIFGIKLNVKHISEFLLEHSDKLTPNGTKAVVTFHDSCRLGRFMKVYEEPRELLSKLGYELREMEKNREDALCCGVPQWVNCDDENKEIRRQKIKEALNTGAEIMVTPCPKCQIHLKCLQRDKSEPEYNIKIMDLSTALVNALSR
jgi:Fe-S oxidoreductase